MKKSLSVVIPVFNEASHVYKSIKFICENFNSTNINYKIILVDDGSCDDTWEEIKKLLDSRFNITALKLSRNFGKESAICAGIEYFEGDGCIIMDCDLQHPPEIIPEMIRFWQDEDYDVVECIKTKRGSETIFTKIGAKLFYYIMKKSSGFNLAGASDFKLLDKKVINSWNLLNERNTFFRGMSAWLGYKRKAIPFVVSNRNSGKTKWSYRKLFKLAINAITAFSSIPLQFVTFLGILFFIGSIILGVQTIVMKIKNYSVSGFTTVILLLLIVGSTIMMSLGIIGMYIARIYEEVKYRPRYLISETINNEEQ